jgi:DNA adenine methylase
MSARRITSDQLELAWSKCTSAPQKQSLAKPFLKWVGGKRWLLGTLRRWLPEPHEVLEYREPFAGGAAIFFALYTLVRRVLLADTNALLIDTYRVVQAHLAALLPRLRELERQYNRLPSEEQRALYHRMRDADVRRMSLVERAAWMLFVNRTSTNGLFRVNQQSRFNAAWGSYRKIRLCDAENLRACSAALAGVELRNASYELTLLDPPPRPGAFYFLDPPYLPASDTSSFTRYGPNGFTLEDHEALASFCERIDAAGARFVLCSSDVPEARRIYGAWHVEPIEAPRRVAMNPASRVAARELVISNFAPRNVADGRSVASGATFLEGAL